MKIYGTSVLKGLLYTLKVFIGTYREDFKRISGKSTAEHGLRTGYDQDGICTVQYPENPMPIGETYERFRVLPMLIYDDKTDGGKEVRCTACGICAKVCPPQCIWIVQETNEAGKPVPHPEDFHIDMSVCMNCGLCTEFCPFDAIKMDHQIELTLTQDRYQGYLYDKERLLVSADYYAGLHPKANAAEVAAREAEAEAKRLKDEAKKAGAAKKAKDAEAGDAGEEKPKAKRPVKAKVEGDDAGETEAKPKRRVKSEAAEGEVPKAKKPKSAADADTPVAEAELVPAPAESSPAPEDSIENKDEAKS